MPFGAAPIILNVIESYCNTSYPSFQDFCLNVDFPDVWDKRYTTATNQVLDLMATGKMRCTHSFYLKLFHLLLMSDIIKPDPIDLLLIDEVQDLTTITLDVVNKFPAKVKVLVGDPAQAIYGFMGCVSAFDFYNKVGITLHLSKSFRVHSLIAEKIQIFCRHTFDPDMVFEGMDYTSMEVKSKAYLTRTNATMINKMIELNRNNTPYKLATSAKVDQIFSLPLAIIYSMPGSQQRKPELKQIQHVVDEWGTIPDTDQRPSKFKYLRDNFDGVQSVIQALDLIAIHGTDLIIETANKAVEHKTSNANLTVMTVHTSKGLTLDEVTLDDDVNSSIEEAMEKVRTRTPLDKEDISELFLYYVACSRTRYKLNNAIYLYL